MTAIWTNDGEGWTLLSPSGFPDEAALHSLIEQSPQLLPLAGSPRLTILGREVRLGNGSADLIAVEPNGRLVEEELGEYGGVSYRQSGCFDAQGCNSAPSACPDPASGP